MNRMPTFALLALLGFAGLGGCARKYVINPDDVAARNDKEWTIKHAPGQAESLTRTPATTVVAVPSPVPASSTK